MNPSHKLTSNMKEINISVTIHIGLTFLSILYYKVSRDSRVTEEKSPIQISTWVLFSFHNQNTIKE